MLNVIFWRFLLFNIGGASLITIAILDGYITPLIETDITGLVRFIFVVFLVGLVVCGVRLYKVTSAKFNSNILKDDLKLVLNHQISSVRSYASSLVFLGLIGTVIGFIVALSGINPDEAGNVNAIAPMVASLIDGMGIALHTTLVGAIGSLWLTACNRLLQTAAIQVLRNVQ